MSDIRFNQWLHQSGTGGITQVDGGHVGIGTTNPDVAVHSGNTKKINVGIVTANSIYAGSLYGDGSNLTSLPAQVTIANNADNRVITGGSGVNLNGETNLLFDGGTLALNGRYQRGSATVQDGDAIAGGININGLDMDSSVIMSVFGNDNDFTRISGSKSRNASVGSHTIVQNNDVLLSLKGFGSDGTNFEEAAQIEMQVDGTPNNNVMPGRIVFKTTTTDGVAERLRITSNGNVGINETAPSEKLQVKGDVLLGSTGGDVALKFEYSDHQFAKIVGNGRDSSGYGDIDFYTSTGSGVSNLLQRMTIRSDGRVGINITDPDSYNNDADALVVSAPSGGGNNSGITIRSNYQGNGSIYFADGSSGNDAYKGYVVYNQPNDIMYLGVQNATKFQINANGAIGLSGSNYGSSGQVLTSQGSGSAVQWATPSAGGHTETYAHVVFGITYDTNSGYILHNMTSVTSNGITGDTTNEKLTPTVAGRYLIIYNAHWNGVYASGTTYYNRITKNGSEEQRSTFASYSSGSHMHTVMCTTAMNGTSDYIQFEFYENRSNATTAYVSQLSRAVMILLDT